VEAEAALPKAARSPEQPATQFIAAIGELYAIEATARDLTVEQRLYLRQQRSRPVLTRLQAMLLAQLHRVLPASLLGWALHYLARGWPKLLRFVDDGRYPIKTTPVVRGGLFADTGQRGHCERQPVLVE
jgi:hypothetical protein